MRVVNKTFPCLICRKPVSIEQMHCQFGDLVRVADGAFFALTLDRDVGVTHYYFCSRECAVKCVARTESS